MSDKLKVAIYSGRIPSSTFLERLIYGLSRSDECKIYVFGKIYNKTDYNSNVVISGYKNRKWYKFVYFFRYSLLLWLFKRKDKLKLDAILKSKNCHSVSQRLKFYPVLWYKPDIFHLQWAKGLSDWMWVQDFGIKLVLSLRGSQINHSPIANTQLADMYRLNFPKLDGFHAVSRAISEEAKRYGALEEKIKVVYSGLDVELSDGIIKNENSKIKLLSIGRPHWIKGYTYALDACKILNNNGVDFQYTIVGAKGNIELAYQIKDLKLDHHVQLLDRIQFDEVKRHMQKADILILSSLKEGIANVVLEAMSLRTIVITTNCGGMTEVIQDELNGFVVPIRDSQLIAETIIKICSLTNKELIKVKDNAYKTVKSCHSEDQMIEGMLTLYQEL